MELHLRYNNTLHHATAAAFIRGADTLTWLKEVDRWSIPADTIECYLLPVSVKSPGIAGLFVIFRDPASVKNIDLLEPYTCIAGKLYIPVHTELQPQVSSAELSKLLIWERQVFHPATGFIGFEKTDKTDLLELVSVDKPVNMDWSFAHPGSSIRPAFNEINVEMPAEKELIESIKDNIGEKPLDEIPASKEGERGILEKIIDSIKFVLLKAILLIGRMLWKIWPKSDRGIDLNKIGGLKKIQGWLHRNLEDLAKKRNEEIQRLLRLFDDNKDEALQYAIPLHSPYLNRGSQSISDRLNRRSTNFNLGNLGGGTITDNWDVGDQYHHLRTKYLNAAQAEIERKNFKRAAYVYAHLLGDYSSAARVLEQGGMYREAAVLYKDHLKNTAAAATCLEKGGLYNEAIGLYGDMARWEKMGDLYMLMEQKENGAKYYEKHIDERLYSRDYIDAARIMNEKMDDTGRAKKTLLKGWDSYNAAEAALKGYFDIVLTKEKENTTKEIKEIYSKHTPGHKRAQLLNVLEYINLKKKKDEELTGAIQEIAFEIVHTETETGNTKALKSLREFLPGDKLIGSDISRYSSRIAAKPSYSRGLKEFQLDQTIKWLKGTWHRNQFLMIGIKDNLLHLARVNWYGNIEYHSWGNVIKPHVPFSFIISPYYSSSVILHSANELPVTRKNLPKNKYFAEALVVYCPVWMHKGTKECIINQAGDIVRLEVHTASMTLHTYSIDGELKSAVNCISVKGEQIYGSVAHNTFMIWNGGYYYINRDKEILVISEGGSTRPISFKSVVRFFAASHSYSQFYIIVSTNKECLLFKPMAGFLGQEKAFAEDLIPIIISFISSTRFVLAEKNAAHLFEIKDDAPRQIKVFRFETRIIAVLPTSDRHQFGVADENGKIILCETEEKY